MELTVVLLKPDCLRKRLVGEVIDRFESNGLTIRGCKMLRFTPELLNKHYGHHANKPFFPELCRFMQSAPVIALALEGEHAIKRVRALVGCTDSRRAPPGTIRGDFTTEVQTNLVHGSDAPETAQTEIALWFKPEELLS